MIKFRVKTKSQLRAKKERRKQSYCSVCPSLILYVCCFSSFATLMVYKIPMEDVQSLAKSFAQLESGE